MCKIIAFSNQKGGVGKTTSVYNVGCAMAIAGKEVLLVDLDPQASLTISTGYSANAFENTIDNAFRDNGTPIENCIYKLPDVSDKLFIAPSSVTLQSVEMLMTAKMGREKMLDKILSGVKKSYDYILIDCPPQMGNLTINALSCADSVVICCKTDYLSYMGLGLIKDSVEEIISYGYINPTLRIEGVIATFYEKVVNDNRDILALMKAENTVLGVVKKTSDVYKDVLSGLPIVMTRPKNDVAKEYVNIAKSLMEVK